MRRLLVLVAALLCTALAHAQRNFSGTMPSGAHYRIAVPDGWKSGDTLVLFQHGLTFDPPDVNRGHYRFEPVTDKVIRYGLGAIKGTGQQAIEAIVKAREEGGPFTSLFDFCVRVDRSRLNKRTVEALIKAGAFDSLQLNRASLVASIDRAFDFATAMGLIATQAEVRGACAAAPRSIRRGFAIIKTLSTAYFTSPSVNG